MYSISKEFGFEYAHRLILDYESPCSCIHGHSAKVITKISTLDLNQNGMVIDFSELRIFQKYLDDYFDHSLLINNKDIELIEMAEKLKFKHLVIPFNPTSENFAKFLFNAFGNMLKKKKIEFDRFEVVFYETKKNYASYNGSIYDLEK